MQSSDVFYQDQLAGRLWRGDQGNHYFQYHPDFVNADAPPLTPNLPKRLAAYCSPHLFPVFYNMLAEGSLRQLQQTTFKLAPQDHFGLLRATARYDTIGAITVRDTLLENAE
jgi:serine/threonine-protein kinase HipA